MKRSEPEFVICVRNKDYPASLELRKVYRLLADEQASKHHQVRVIDESGEDPAGWRLDGNDAARLYRWSGRIQPRRRRDLRQGKCAVRRYRYRGCIRKGHGV
jgi:hypothetical protein